MVQWLRKLPALSEGQSWVSTAHVKWLTTASNSSSRRLNVLFWLPEAHPHTCIYNHAHMHTFKKINKAQMPSPFKISLQRYREKGNFVITYNTVLVRLKKVLRKLQQEKKLGSQLVCAHLHTGSFCFLIIWWGWLTKSHEPWTSDVAVLDFWSPCLYFLSPRTAYTSLCSCFIHGSVLSCLHRVFAAASSFQTRCHFEQTSWTVYRCPVSPTHPVALVPRCLLG